MTMTRIQLRRGTAAEWLTANPVLADGEKGIEIDTGKEKTGDGVSAWTGLTYVAVTQAELDTKADVAHLHTNFLETSGDQSSTGKKSFEVVLVKSSPYTDVTHPDFGCLGDNIANDRPGLQLAINATPPGGTILLPIPPGTSGIYRCTDTTPLTLPVDGLTFLSPGRNKAEIRGVGTNTDLFSVTGTRTNIGFDKVKLRCGAGAGHVFNADGAVLAQWTWDLCHFQVDGTAKSIWNQVGGQYIAMRLFNFELTGVPNGGSTVSLWKVVSSTGALNKNTCRTGRANNSGDYVFHFEETGAFHANDNLWADIFFEITVGGNIRLLSSNGGKIEDCATYDLQAVGPTTKNLYAIANSATGLQSQDNALKNVHRRGGTLGTGLRDVKLTDVRSTEIENCNGTIDLGGTTATLKDMPSGAGAAVILDRGAGTTEIGRGHVRIGAYSTTTRPSASTLGAGANIFNTTTGKPEWSDGSVWRDAAGTAVA